MKTKLLRASLLVVCIIISLVISFLFFAPSFNIVEQTPERIIALDVYGSPVATPMAEQRNLISNSSFERPYYTSWTQETQIAHGWSYTFTQFPYCNPNHDDCDIPCPENCKKSYSGSDSIDVGDSNVWLQGDRLEVGKTTTITFGLNVTYPVSAIELFVYHNQSIVSVSNPQSLHGKVRTHPFYSVYELELESGWSQGKLDLFTLQFTPISTGVLHLEAVYFIGTDSGGWAGGGWYPGIAPARRVTNTIEIFERTKCRSDYGCYWATPECKAIDASSYPYRVRSGESAQQCFAYKRMYRAYFYQQVIVEPGVYEFGVYAHSWQCFDYDNCCNGRCSDLPDLSNFRVGISPNGAIDPQDDSIVWGQYKQIFDDYGIVNVIAKSETPTITVIIEESPKIRFAKSTDSHLDDAFLFKHNRVYLPILLR